MIFIPFSNAYETAHFFFKWVKVFKNGPSKICGRQPLKRFKKI